MAIPLQTHFQSSGCDGCSCQPGWDRLCKARVLIWVSFQRGTRKDYTQVAESRDTPKWSWREVSLNYWNCSGIIFFYPFHVVWRDNLYVLTLGYKESLRSHQPWYQDALQKVCCTPSHGVKVTRVLQVERRLKIKLSPELPPSAALSVWIWKRRLFYLSLPCFLSLMQSLLERGGDTRERGSAVAAVVLEGCSLGDMLNAMSVSSVH